MLEPYAKQWYFLIIVLLLKMFILDVSVKAKLRY